MDQAPTCINAVIMALAASVLLRLFAAGREAALLDAQTLAALEEAAQREADLRRRAREPSTTGDVELV